MYGSEAGFAAIIGIFLFAWLFWLAILIGGYVLRGLALSRLAQNAGLAHPGLAWVPVAGTWLLGVLCDRSQQALTGKRWRFDVILPALEVLASLGGSLLAGPGGFFAQCYLYAGFSYSTLREALQLFAGLCYLAVLGAALWQLYQDYAPEQALLYTALSVILGRVGRGVLLLTIRDKTPCSAGPGFRPPPPPPRQSGPGSPNAYRSGTGTTGWGQPPYQSGPGTTGWGQPPYQSGTGTTGWGQPPYQSGTGTTGWGQPPYQSGPGANGQDQPPRQDMDRSPAPAPPFRWDAPRDGDDPGNRPG